MLVSSLIILTLVGLASCPPPPPTKKVPQLLQKQVAPKHLPQKQKQRPLQLTISPTSVTLYPGKKVTVKCRVKGTYAITQWLDIGFYVGITLIALIIKIFIIIIVIVIVIEIVIVIVIVRTRHTRTLEYILPLFVVDSIVRPT